MLNRKFSNLGFPIYRDKDKAVYNEFATRYIPRNYIINTEGKIVYTSIGFSEEEFNNMINILNDLMESNSKQ